MTNNKKCNTDVHEFMEKYKVGFDRMTMGDYSLNKSKHQLFKYYDFEKRIINTIHDNKNSIILKSRQMHVTTLLATYTAYQMLNGKTIGYFSPTKKTDFYFINKVKQILMNFGIKGFYIHCKEELKIGDGLLNLPSGIGQNIEYDIFIVDEAAYIKNLKDRLHKNFPKLLDTGKIIMSSTPPLKKDYFYEQWSNSKNNSNLFSKIKINYKDNPKFNSNEEWLEHMKKALNYDIPSIEREVYGNFYFEKPKKVKNKNNKKNQLQFRVSDDLYLKICEKLIDNDIKLSEYMRKLIIKDMDK